MISQLAPLVPTGAYPPANAGGVFSSDAELERQINFQYGLIATSLTPDEQRTALEEMTRLIAQRSPRQIERMERGIFNR